jgi:transcriptional regulator with XRE-family HTH domain
MARYYNTPPQLNKEPHHMTFGDFLVTKRREKEIPSMQVCENIDISPSYYCDIERNRRYPPDRKTLAKLADFLGLYGEEKALFYDLAGKARSEAPPDLPEYINANQVVRVALRLAKDKGRDEDWRSFIAELEKR